MFPDKPFAWEAAGQLHRAVDGVRLALLRCVRELLPSADSTTVVAAVVIEDLHTAAYRAVSVGTGTRSIPFEKEEVYGLAAVRDCHAEVVARRGFVSFLLDWVTAADKSSPGCSADQQPSSTTALVELLPELLNRTATNVADTNGGMGEYTLNTARYRVWLAVTHPPCGDAAISESLDTTTGSGTLTNDGSVHKDLKPPSCCAVEVGLARVKPGKGAPSLCMSCSDKIAMWGQCGLQGAAAGLVVGRVPLHGVVAPRDVCDITSLHRAIVGRCDCCREQVPIVALCAPLGIGPTPSVGSDGCTRGISTTGSSVVAVVTPNGWTTTSINSKDGLVLGVTKKAALKNRGAGAAPISRYWLARRVLRLVRHRAMRAGSSPPPLAYMYGELKQQNGAYKERKRVFLASAKCFHRWVAKVPAGSTESIE